MSLSTTATEFRQDISCSVAQLSDDTFLRYYNDCRDELIDAIIKENEDYFFSTYSWTTVIWQNDYTLQQRTTSLDWIYKIKWVSAKFKSTDTYFTKIEPKRIEELDYDLATYTNTVYPFYLIQNNILSIYPTPTEAVWYKIYHIKLPKKLLISDTDTLPDQHINALLYGVKKRFLESEQRLQEVQIANQEWENAKVNVCKALSGIVIEPITRTTPNLSYLT